MGVDVGVSGKELVPSTRLVVEDVTIGTCVQNATKGKRDIGKSCYRVDVDIIFGPLSKVSSGSKIGA